MTCCATLRTCLLLLVVAVHAAPWQPILPRGLCATDEDCSLNGECVQGTCRCHESWEGHNCQRLRLQPLAKTAGYGEAPNVSSWGASIFHDGADYHMFVTEETDGKGLASWVTNSQIVHAVASTPEGPYQKRDVVSPPPTTNPQVLYDPLSSTFLLFHIRGGSDFGLFTSESVDGPWNSTRFAVGGCNNPSAAFHRNGSLFVMCHDSNFTMYRFDANGSQPAWKQASPAARIPTLQKGKHKDVQGNCEDPFLYVDRNGYFHAIAHCYTCYWYPAASRPKPGGGSTPGSCQPGTAFCAGHGFSRTGEAGNWTWIGGGDAPYNFTSIEADGVTVREFSTRERPWALLGGSHGDSFIALVNGVSPAMPQNVKYIEGIDWTYTNVQPVAH